jgi:aryl-alcohol dehydrogenase-like predicted oxidoreductase
MHTRPVPSTGEPLPVIGCGTYRGFDVRADRSIYARLQHVLDALFAAGGSVIDSSPMYGRAEAVTGDLLAQSNTHAKAFIATKVWTRGRDVGIAQMEDSFRLLQTERIDLMQIHNLVDWRTHLPVLRTWKDAGRIRYIGITHYTSSAFAELEAVMRAEPLDFVQLNYSAVDRAAERRLLPLAAERGIGVIVNYPLASGAAVRGVNSRPLPDWAAEIDCRAGRSSCSSSSSVIRPSPARYREPAIPAIWPTMPVPAPDGCPTKRCGRGSPRPVTYDERPQ